MTDAKYFGHATKFDGTHVPLSQEEAAALWKAADDAKVKRSADMPTTKEAMQALMTARDRLEGLGWRNGVYCPKDGSPFAVIEYGSTGVFVARYFGTWPDGHLIYGDSAEHPKSVMFKPLADLTSWKKAHMDQCDKAERQMAERELAAFAAAARTLRK